MLTLNVASGLVTLRMPSDTPSTITSNCGGWLTVPVPPARTTSVFVVAAAVTAKASVPSGSAAPPARVLADAAAMISIALTSGFCTPRRNSRFNVPSVTFTVAERMKPPAGPAVAKASMLSKADGIEPSTFTSNTRSPAASMPLKISAK